MSYYVFGDKQSYKDYLTAKNFSRDTAPASRKARHRISAIISKKTRDVIASNDALARESIQALEAAEEHPSMILPEGFLRLLYDLQDISPGISGLNATFHWGFGQMIASMGKMNDTLTDLFKAARTSAQTAAYEHYEIARDAFRQQLYEESLEALDKAISGDHISPGYKLEWRFHHMKGTIQLGFAGSDPALIDHAGAEKSFLLAARYAKADYPEHAAQAYLCAGWAAYCQGRMDEALSHTEQAITINPNLGEAYFQTAKIHMATGEVEAALTTLEKAIDIDRFYALKAAGDGDFQKHDMELRDFLETLRSKKYRQCVPLVQSALEKLRFYRENSPEADSSKAFRLMDTFINNGANWPLLDMLAVVQGLDKTITQARSLPIVVTITCPDQSCLYEETYQEEVPAKHGGRSRKTADETKTKVRSVTESRIVTKSIPGQTVRIEFCYIPAGTFIMGGSTPNTDDRHEVTISREFYFGKYPVTQAQWEAVMGNNPSSFKGPDRPVENVSWSDCQSFIEKLNYQADDNLYRLPTEAQWEYACRAGSTTACYFGEDEGRLGEYAWYQKNSNRETHPVGKKKPNAWGLYDMHGNVWEWCQDWYGNYPAGPVIDPRGPSSGSNRVLRGGGWRDFAGDCFSGIRYSSSPGNRFHSIGFRLVRIIR